MKPCACTKGPIFVFCILLMAWTSAAAAPLPQKDTLTIAPKLFRNQNLYHLFIYVNNTAGDFVPRRSFRFANYKVYSQDKELLYDWQADGAIVSIPSQRRLDANLNAVTQFTLVPLSEGDYYVVAELEHAEQFLQSPWYAFRVGPDGTIVDEALEKTDIISYDASSPDSSSAGPSENSDETMSSSSFVRATRPLNGHFQNSETQEPSLSQQQPLGQNDGESKETQVSRQDSKNMKLSDSVSVLVPENNVLDTSEFFAGIVGETGGSVAKGQDVVLSNAPVTNTFVPSQNTDESEVTPPDGTQSASHITIQGRIFAEDGATLITYPQPLGLVINGQHDQVFSSDGTGVFSVTAEILEGEPFLIYKNDLQNPGVTVSVSAGADINTFDIFQNTLIVRHEQGSAITNQTMAQAHPGLASVSEIYFVSGSKLRVGAQKHLRVPQAHAFMPVGDIDVGISGTSSRMDVYGQLLLNQREAVHIYGTWNVFGEARLGQSDVVVEKAVVIGGGSFEGGTALITVRERWTYAGGAVNAAGSTVFFQGGAFFNPITVDASGMTFHDVRITGFIFDAVDTMDINGSLQLEGTFLGINGVLRVAGDLVSVNPNVGGRHAIVIDGDRDQRLHAKGGVGAIPGLRIEKSGGILRMSDTIDITVNGWTHVSGSVDAGASTVIFSANDHSVDAGTMHFYDLVLDMGKGYKELNIVGTMFVDGDLTVKDVSSINTGMMAVYGDVAFTDPFVVTRGNGLLRFAGGQDQMLSVSPNPGVLGVSVEIDKTAGSVLLSSAISMTQGGLRIQGGVLDCEGYPVSMHASLPFVVANGGVIQLNGHEVFSRIPVLESGSTVVYDGSVSHTGLLLGSRYSHLRFDGAGQWQLNADLVVKGDFDIRAGTVVGLAAGQIRVGGSWLNRGGFLANNSRVILESSDHVALDSGAQPFSKLAMAGGLVGYWTFDDSGDMQAADVSGFEAAGQLNNMVLTDWLAETPMAINFSNSHSLQFNANDNDDFLSLPHETMHDLSSMTLSLWFKTIQTGAQVLLSAAHAGAYDEMQIRLDSATQFRVRIQGTNHIWSIPDVADNQWHHVVVTRDADQGHVSMILDGFTETTQQGTTSPLRIDPNGLIMAQHQGQVGGSFDPSLAFEGVLDDLRIYNHVLNLAQVTSLSTGHHPVPQASVRLDNALHVLEDLTLNSRLEGNGHPVMVDGTWLTVMGEFQP